MSSIPTEVFAVKVYRPGLFRGPAELRVGSDSVTLVARPIRYGRGLIVFENLWNILVALVGAYFFFGLLSAADVSVVSGLPQLIAGVFILMILVAGSVSIMGGVIELLRKALRGEPREMTLPLMRVRYLKRNRYAVVLNAPFDSETHSSKWNLYARNSADAKAIKSALTAGAA